MHYNNNNNEYFTRSAILGVSNNVAGSLYWCHIWDNYPEDILKSVTHQRGGTDPRTRIRDGHTQIPQHDLNSGFLKYRDNKKELFSFISEHIIKKDLGGKLLLSTK